MTCLHSFYLVFQGMIVLVLYFNYLHSVQTSLPNLQSVLHDQLTWQIGSEIDTHLKKKATTEIVPGVGVGVERGGEGGKGSLRIINLLLIMYGLSLEQFIQILIQSSNIPISHHSTRNISTPSNQYVCFKTHYGI